MAVKLVTFIHDSAFAEDSLSGLGEAPGGANPFDNNSIDLKQQAELLERNPFTAKRMILAAGRDPEFFGLS